MRREARAAEHGGPLERWRRRRLGADVLRALQGHATREREEQLDGARWAPRYGSKRVIING